MNGSLISGANGGRPNLFVALLELLFGLAVVVAVPMVFLGLLGISNPVNDLSVQRTAVTATIAFIIGSFFLRRLLNFPGVRGAVHGAPIMLLTFIAAALVLLILRIEYSRYMLVLSTSGAVLFAFVRAWIVPLRTNQIFHLVPFGKIGVLKQIPDRIFIDIEKPEIPVGNMVNIVADFRADLPDEWERMLAQASLRGIPVYHYKQLIESLTGKVNIEHLSENFFGSLVPSQSYTPIKRLIDLVGSLILLVVLSPVFALLALLIWMEDRGPVFFIQTRHGYGGKPFRMYKFRSMRTAEAADGVDARESAITKDGDDRITPIGRVIRRSRLDELPQLVNVLKGEMSLIGPRPEANALAEWYDQSLGFYAYRTIVKPGLTGWAQVNQGHVANLEEVNTKLQYDFYYIKYFSFWLDMLIVMRTIQTIVTGFGSK
ncbi:MAG: sugar transferase [Erythrobacter sp.]|nr:sugar transferase [Erythrobacter sp.]NCQ63586.1 sugar transferase [Alphaproteobacteria bacterium]